LNQRCDVGGFWIGVRILEFLGAADQFPIDREQQDAQAVDGGATP
jgi:hypothetical protein